MKNPITPTRQTPMKLILIDSQNSLLVGLLAKRSRRRLDEANDFKPKVLQPSFDAVCREIQLGRF
jgi:hypothetical protein